MKLYATKYFITVKLKKIFISSATIQEKQSVILRDRVFWLWLCIIWNHRSRMTCNNFQNFTKFSKTSICLHSGGIIGFSFCYSPAFCHWTTPSTPSGLAQIDFNYIINLRDYTRWPEPILIRAWDDALQTAGDTWIWILSLRKWD